MYLLHLQKYFRLTVTSFSVIFVISFFTAQGTTVVRDNTKTAYYLHIYNAINYYRALHTIPALRWNRTTTETAEDYAVSIVQQVDPFSPVNCTGCDIYITSGNTRPIATEVALGWYSEGLQYDFENPGYDKAYSNYTQLIWKSSTSVGIGTYSGNNVTAIVAQFYPAGNVVGKFRQNVIPVYQKM